MKNAIIILLLLVIGAGGSYFFLLSKNKTPVSAPAKKDATEKHGHSPDDMCPEHKILEKDCPWCDKSIISSRGQCEHSIPKALCIQCKPELIEGFKSVNDWCSGHNVPESQCKKCQGGESAPGENKK